MWDDGAWDEPEPHQPPLASPPEADAEEPGPHPKPRLRFIAVLIVLAAFVISACLCCLAVRSATGLLDLDPDQLWGAERIGARDRADRGGGAAPVRPRSAKLSSERPRR